MKIINFNFKAGQQLPVHAHDIEGQLSIAVLEGRGMFIGAEGRSLPANPGDVLVSDIREPHGIRAESDMRVLVTIAPPI
jgi:quercetin dioxygenase-like cupin family protein